MQLFIDFLPVAAFVVAYWLGDIYTAVLVIMVAMGLQVAATWLLTRTVGRMLLASAGLVWVLGGATLLLRDALFIKWKPTVLNWAFAAIVLGSQFIGERPVMQRLLQSVAKNEFSLSDADWRRLNLMWAAFFLASGAANIYVAYNFPEHIWVNFKLFGLMGLTFVFALLQAYWISSRTGGTAPGSGSGD